MILADKIMTQRKKNGWTQEELAEKMEVSRQAVSKWESMQAVPDLEKILQLGELFGVTTDYLLKQTVEEEEYTDSFDTEHPIRQVSLEEAHAYLDLRKKASIQIAFATFLYIISPLPLMNLAGFSESSVLFLSEAACMVIGLISLLLLVAGASALMISCGQKSSAYEYLKKLPFKPAYGVRDLVREKQKAYHAVYTKSNILAVGICILSPIPLFASLLFDIEFLMILMLSVTMILAGIGVMIFLITGVKQASMNVLLQEEDYSIEKKKRNSFNGQIAVIFWLFATAIYLGLALTTHAWGMTWVVWPIAGVIYIPVVLICNLLRRKE